MRGTLFEKIVKIVKEKQPQYFLLENVKRILTMEKGEHFRVILNSLASLDYFVEWRIVSPIHFGIPQNRDRIFILGTRVSSPQDSIPDFKDKSVFLTNHDRLDDDLFNSSNKFKSISDFRGNNQNWGIAYQNQTTLGLREILQRNGNKDDVIGFLEDRNLPLDEIGRELLADRIIFQLPELGYITISNALQWRLQYRRIIDLATLETSPVSSPKTDTNSCSKCCEMRLNGAKEP